MHMLDIHMEKGMHCVDCHFVQDEHGNNRLQMEVRAAVEIQCVDCHGGYTTYARLRTGGPAAYTSNI
ncbi:cytochrome c3 family protein, partial [Pseudomonas aeruginosa]